MRGLYWGPPNFGKLSFLFPSWKLLGGEELRDEGLRVTVQGAGLGNGFRDFGLGLGVSRFRLKAESSSRSAYKPPSLANSNICRLLTPQIWLPLSSRSTGLRECTEPAKDTRVKDFAGSMGYDHFLGMPWRFARFCMVFKKHASFLGRLYCLSKRLQYSPQHQNYV